MRVTPLQRNAIFVLAWYCCGVLATMRIQGWSFLTANYVVMQIVTTIGYGDIGVSPSMHAFFSVYVLSGLMIVANVINDGGNALIAKNMKVLKKAMRDIEDKLDDSVEGDDQTKKAYGKFNEMLASLLLFLMFVFGGAWLYSSIEACSCGYGADYEGLVEGCDNSSYAKCVETGGKTKSFAEGVYMAVITLTTVGFGDFSPVSELGRGLGLVWMLLGVLSCGNFIGAFASWLDEVKEEELNTETFSDEVWAAIDKDSNGTFSRAEFALFMLVKRGVVKLDDLSSFDSLYEKVKHKDNKGELRKERVITLLNDKTENALKRGLLNA